MLPFLVLHICALLAWSAGLLYLPTLLTENVYSKTHDSFSCRRSALPRWLFTRVVTPAALLAIMAGTAVFLLNRTTTPWLIAKLALVSLLVLLHAAMGLMIMRFEDGRLRHPQRWNVAHTISTCTTLLAILYLVLAKPDWEGTQ